MMQARNKDLINFSSITAHSFDISMYGLNIFQTLQFRYVQYAFYVRFVRAQIEMGTFQCIFMEKKYVTGK